MPTPCALQGCLCRNALPWSLSCRLNSSHKSKAAPRCCCPLLPAAQAARCLLAGIVGDMRDLPTLPDPRSEALSRRVFCNCCHPSHRQKVRRGAAIAALQLSPVRACFARGETCSLVLRWASSCQVAFHGRFGLSLFVQLLQEGFAWRGVHHCAGAATTACNGLRPTISCPRGLTTTFRDRAAHILDSVFHRLGDKLNHTLDAVFFHAVCSLSFLGGISTVV